MPAFSEGMWLENISSLMTATYKNWNRLISLEMPQVNSVEVSAFAAQHHFEKCESGEPSLPQIAIRKTKNRKSLLTSGSVNSVLCFSV
jgi:hypothetical protein